MNTGVCARMMLELSIFRKDTTSFAMVEMSHIRLDIVLEHQRQLVQDVGHAHGAGTLEQAGVEIALHVQAVDVRVGVAVAVAAAHEELSRGAVQIAVAP